MYRRRLADVQKAFSRCEKAFSRLFQQNVHRYTHGLSELSGRCTDNVCGCHCSKRGLLLPVPCLVWACLEGRTTSQ